MEQLREIKCVACEGIGAKMEETEAAEWHEQIPAWHREGTNFIEREYRFKNFRDAMAFANDVAEIAEADGHHPDIAIGWGRCSIRLTTHALGGLTLNDFAQAARIEALTATAPIIQT
jgi:4a-hydroxytetrahydrobiopterin dehydratase